MYITFEGPEATGKSTQVKLVGDCLAKLGVDVLVTKEPGSPHDRVCQQIRTVLLSTDNDVGDLTALLLFLADRAQHIEKVVKPALAQGKVVISDRASLSTLVYHLSVRENMYDISDEEMNTLAAMLNTAQQIRPDVCFIARSNIDWSSSQFQTRASIDPG